MGTLTINVITLWWITCTSMSQIMTAKGWVALEQIQTFPIFGKEKLGKNFLSTKFLIEI